MKSDANSDDLFQLVLPPSGTKSDAKKRLILEATIEILANQGIEEITFESLGDKLQTTKANIRYHFHDKDELIFLAVKFMAFTAQSVTATMVKNAQKPQDKLNGVILGAYRHLKTNPSHVRAFMMYFYYASIFSNYRELFTQSRMIGQLRLSKILHDLPRRDGQASVKSLMLLADQIQNLITGQIFGVVLLGGSFSTSTAQTQNMVKALLAGEGIKWQVS
ncbi:MAG: TetR/AcrR family transcriptional regulator [Bdellovibrionales bacterium]|nr:TetR/AcrR family transcriptional regulator [Bdellovibrionales bacterium]